MEFEGIIGHEKQKKLLLSFVKGGRLPHAFLFSGQDGIGKKKVAVALTKLLFCEKGTGCGSCLPCSKVEHRNHPDLLLIEEESSIGIDRSRMMSREIYEFPYEAQKRVIIIDRAETMTHEASNALLKTLEEPPPFNIFFLITSSEKSIAATIRSRCARVPFMPITDENVTWYFTHVAGLGEEESRLVASMAFGSIRCGLFWTNAENLAIRRKLAELVTGKNRSFLSATQVSERVSVKDEDLSMYLSFLLSFLRDMYVVKESGDLSLAVNRDFHDLLVREQADERWIERALKRTQEACAAMRYNVNKWLLFEDLLMAITR